jgi:hypothetical protein
MARLNLTIPDQLYERLEQVRDRVNVSRICAVALEKELAMLEGRPTVADPKIAQLLQRLQSGKERWHSRGHEDGTQWAVDVATRRQLQTIAAELADTDGLELVEEAHPEHWVPDPYRRVLFPESFALAERLDSWVIRDAEVGELPTREEQERIERFRAAIDEPAYLEGWRDAIKEIWQTVKPALG